MNEATPMCGAGNCLDLDMSTALAELLVERSRIKGVPLPRDARNGRAEARTDKELRLRSRLQALLPLPPGYSMDDAVHFAWQLP